MRFAIGDVVRDRDDQALGTVAGLASHPDGPLVAVQVSDDLRLAEPEDLDIVARAPGQAVPAGAALTVFGYTIASLLAYAATRSARELGADWVLSMLAGLGGFATITTAMRWALRLAGPRRFRL
jgi:hypothetical protein